jgi:hypothetical protein
MIRTFIGIASLVGLGGAASAQQAGAASPAVAPQSKIVVTGKAKRVCERSIETGSLMPSRVCRTQGEWDELHQTAVNALERIRNNRTLVSMQRE